MKRILNVLLLVGLLAGCKKEEPMPNACIEPEKTNAKTNESINFKSCTSNSTKAYWNFGDGTTSEGLTVSHTYSQAGEYRVTLTAENKDGSKRDDESVMINISE